MKIRARKMAFYASSLSIILLGACVNVLSKDTEASSSSKLKTVLVELFTSEGCSSCPQADTVLMRLQKEQPLSGVRIITMSENVPYWNYLGWTDPYSSEPATQRQKSYAAVFGNASLYTPQMVVDGRTEFNGSDYNHALEAIKKSSSEERIGLSIAGKIEKSALSFKGEMIIPKALLKRDIILEAALVEDNLVSQVSRGENSGRRLNHSSVVRTFVNIPHSIDSPASSFEKTIAVSPKWKKNDLRLVVFAENLDTREIVGVNECLVN